MCSASLDKVPEGYDSEGEPRMGNWYSPSVRYAVR
jgi:hypothetical protein